MTDLFSFVLTETPPAPSEAVVLYRAAKWWGKEDDLQEMQKLLDGTSAVVCARDADGRLLGMMRAISDGAGDAYMLDLVVAPEYRRRGIGKAIAERLAAVLHQRGVGWIVCIGVPGTEKLYGSCAQSRIMKDHTPWRFYGDAPSC